MSTPRRPAPRSIDTEMTERPVGPEGASASSSAGTIRVFVAMAWATPGARTVVRPGNATGPADRPPARTRPVHSDNDLCRKRRPLLVVVGHLLERVRHHEHGLVPAGPGDHLHRERHPLRP